MPVLQSAKKMMRQSLKRKARNFPLRSELKSVMKKFVLLVKENKKEEAEKLVAHAFSIIDTASKKHLIHKNNAARKKSRLAKAISTKQVK